MKPAIVIDTFTIPQWAKRLESIEILPNGMLVGETSSRKDLEETLDFHSRAILCDYIKR